MNVVVAEKPSVARDLAKVLGATTRCEGYLEGNGWQVTWALGHLATLKTPDEYDPALKRWSMDRLPFVPERFELKAAGDRGRKAQLDILAGLCRGADELVCATDAGREGELIFRYILEYAGCPERPHTRLWLSSLTEEAIKAGLESRKPSTEYEALHDAARSRSEADWIVGLNATRAYTVRYGGGSVLWSLGRVQTPVLAMIAQRDDEIRVFDSRPFWELRTKYRKARFKFAGERFREQDAAQEILGKVEGEPLVVERIETKHESLPPPNLFDLTQLQRDMNLRHGMSAARTLTVAQELYERKVLTYPRTDSRYLSMDMVDSARSTLGQLRHWNPSALALLQEYIAGAPEGERGPRSKPKRVFDDNKVTDHHAIVPTGKLESMTGEHRLVFDAVATRFVQVFMGNRMQDVTTVHAKSVDVPFRARGVVITDPGWSALEPSGDSDKPKPKGKGKKKADDDDERQVLPQFEEGEAGPHKPELHEGKTKAPRPYTENTLLAAMETSGKLIDDEALREAMKGRGIGTPATRASIVETLLSRSYIQRDKKALRVTDLGRYLIAIIADPVLKSPELTGEWEQKLGEIERGKRERTAFMDEIGEMIRHLIAEGLSPPLSSDELGQCPLCSAKVVEGREAYGCSRWREDCKFRVSKTYREVPLSRYQVRELYSRGVVTRPVRIDGEPRILCRTASGEVIDLQPPSRDAQRGRDSRGSRAPSGKAAAAKAPAKKAAKKAPAKKAAKRKPRKKPGEQGEGGEAT
jgi:DNA topoisomerase III